MPHNPFRVAIRWIADDAFPRCRVVIPGDPPHHNFGIVSHWQLPAGSMTSERLAKALDEIRKGVTVEYSADQLRVLAVSIRKTLNKVENFLGDDDAPYPWYAGFDPWGDKSYEFRCEYKGKQSKGELVLWLTPLDVVEV